MSEERMKPLWPWIVALLVALPVLYVASIPAQWWFDRKWPPEEDCLYDHARGVYLEPFNAVWRIAPPSLQRSMHKFRTALAP